MSDADNARPLPSAEERLRHTVTENVQLALRLLLGIVVLMTPVVFLLAPENIWNNAAPRAVTFALIAISLWALPRRDHGEGAGFILLSVTAVTAMSLYEASLTQMLNHPSGLSPLLFFLGAMMIAPLKPGVYLLLGVIVVCAPLPFWWSSQLDADPAFRIMYSASGVIMGIAGAASSWQRRKILLARFEAEEALTERSERLRQATEQLKLARDAAQASDRAKSRFLSQVSHETRTPLSGILGFTELLELRAFGELNERQAGYVRQIRESGEHMLELINDLLDITRLDTDAVELDLEDVSPAEVVLEVVDNVALGSREKSISILNEIGVDTPAVKVDRRRFRQSLYNLLSNAVKFTPAGRSVGLRWQIEPEGWLCIEVWDEGVGIASEELESIFDEFHQVDRKRDESLGGSGIGLALTRRLANLHGGEVRVESALGRGSNFFLVMPLADQQANSSARDAQPERRSQPPSWRAASPDVRVLVVDDSPANIAVIQGLLEVRGVDPLVSFGGQDAVSVVDRERPHLVLMDIHMPGCDGFDALAQIRALERRTQTPVIAMTASSSESDQMRYLEAGFDGFLSKPIDSVKLDEQLERFVPPTSPS